MNVYMCTQVGIKSIICIQYDFVTKCFTQIVNIILTTVYSRNFVLICNKTPIHNTMKESGIIWKSYRYV